MDAGESEEVTHGRCSDLWVVETGMYGVTGYGCVYVLDAERPTIVETGTGANVDKIVGAIEDVGLSPEDIEFIVITHVHLDHAGGAGHLAEVCENATVVVSERGAPHLVDPGRLVAGTKAAVGDQWKYYADPQPVPESRVRAVSPDDHVDLGDRTFVVHPAPGHARHQLIYAVEAMDAIFTGDAAGIWHPGRRTIFPTAPPPEFDLDMALTDVDRIAAIEPSTLLYTHFGPAAADRLLDRYVDTLVDWVELVERTHEATDGEAETVERLLDSTDYIDVWGAERGRAEVELNVRGALMYLDRVAD